MIKFKDWKISCDHEAYKGIVNGGSLPGISFFIFICVALLGFVVMCATTYIMYGGGIPPGGNDALMYFIFGPAFIAMILFRLRCHLPEILSAFRIKYVITNRYEVKVTGDILWAEIKDEFKAMVRSKR